MADFILNMPLRFFARVFGNPAGDPVLLKSRGVTLLRDNVRESIFGEFEHANNLCTRLLLSVGGSLYNNRFGLYTIIHITMRCDTITR